MYQTNQQGQAYQVPPQQYSYDPEMGYGKTEEEGGYGAFMEKQVRQGFIRKVFGILAVQLFITFGAAILMSSNDDLKAYVQGNMWPFYVSFPLLFGSLIGLACCGDTHRQFPQNYLLLGLFTISESYMVGMATMAYETETVLQAIAITGVVTLGLVIYAMQTKYDFTTSGGFLFSALMVFICFSFLAIIMPYNKLTHIAFASVGALLFSCYLVYDVQLLMDGKRMQLSPDDYVLAAVNLYLDILNLFLYILQILGESK